MLSTDHIFSISYQQARNRFLTAATDAGLVITTHEHPEIGKEGEMLALDVALQGSPGSGKMLVISSGCHGVEGFCGSGIQLALLNNPEWMNFVNANEIAVLYIHALNPHGFSYLRRVTEENVDLNRNFVDFNQPLHRNHGYDELAHLLVPPDWPMTAEVRRQIEEFIAERGFEAFLSALSGGQYHHQSGQMFGGTHPSWSNLTLSKVLKEMTAKVKQLGWIDIHTGLGECGHAELIFLNHNNEQDLLRTRAWWGEDVTSYYNGSSNSTQLSGNLWCGIRAACPHLEYTGIALEIGTRHYEQVMLALTADHWLHVHPEADQTAADQIHQDLVNAFFVDTPEWKQSVLDQGLQVATKAIAALANSTSVCL